MLLKEDLLCTEEWERAHYHRQKSPRNEQRFDTKRTTAVIFWLGLYETELLSDVLHNQGKHSPGPCDMAEVPAGRECKA